MGVPFLTKMLSEEVSEGWTELSCHPGYVSYDYSAVYLSEREEEVRTLTDSRTAQCIDRLNITLASYIDYAKRGNLDKLLVPGTT